MPPEKKSSPEAEARQAQARRKIGDLFEEALAQRSKFHLAFEPGVTSLKNITGALYSYDNLSVVLELTGVKGYSQKWQNEVVTAYFEIVDRGLKQGIFYSFDARIEQIKEKDGERLFLHLSFPLAVDRAQRRKSLRVDGDLDCFDQFTMWAYNAEGKFDLSNPFLRLDDFASGAAKLDNISAGGLRIQLTQAFLHGKAVEIASGQRFIISVTVKNTQCPGDKDVWLIARVNNTYENPVTRQTEAGIEFIAEGKINPDNKVIWKKVSGHVVENVGAWTYTWYLLQIR
jgi:c-di-GMP-binding flagellar brake protein YcgR